VLGDAAKQLDTRYKQRSAGVQTFTRLTICGDEWRAIAKNVDGAGETLTAIATEGRKVRLTLLAASHNDTVASLGVSGDKEAFLSSFDYLVYTGAFASKRFGDANMPTIETPNGTIPAFAYVLCQNNQRAYTLDLRDIPVVTLSTPSIPSTHQRNDALLNALLNITPATTPLERAESDIAAATTPTTTTLEKGANGGESESENESSSGRSSEGDDERATILTVAHAVIEEQGKLSRSEVCRRVYGTAGGAAYNKVKMVLDAAGM
jgi:hypothetical protein